MFPRIYTDPPIACPLAGYEGWSFRVLLNPTGQEKTDWWNGGVGQSDCPNCQATEAGRRYCAACQAERDRWGRVLPAIYGTSHAAHFDFSTPEASLASIEQPDLPDEFLAWLLRLPTALWAARMDDVKKKLPPPSTTGGFTPD